MTSEFRLLGPVEVWADGRAVPAGEPRRRAVLAALLVDAGHVVPLATLIDRVWGERPPRQVGKTLAAHVTRVRQLLGEAAGDDAPATVVNEPGGYRITVDRDRVDLHRFRRLVRDARQPDRTDRERAGLLRRALDLWHGEPLTGLSGDWAQRTREHLTGEYLEATASWADASLAAGDAARVLTPLTELASAHPLMEPLTALLVRALVATGRPSEALERCRAHGRRLADEQGTDQGPELRSLYQAILRGELRPAGPETGTPPPAADPAPVLPGRRRRRTSMVFATVLCAAVTLVLAAVSTPGLRHRAARNATGSPTGAPDRGTPSVVTEDFARDQLPDQWAPYDQKRSNGSSWSSAMVRVDQGLLRIDSAGRNPSGAGNLSGGVCWCRAHAVVRTYGTWRVRARFDAGAGYGAVLGLYPEHDDGHAGYLTLARLDEPTRTKVYAVIGDADGHQRSGSRATGDFTGWHVYSIEWRPEFIRITVDDTVLFDTRTHPKHVAIPDSPMYLYLNVNPGPDGPVPPPDASTPDHVVSYVDWTRYQS